MARLKKSSAVLETARRRLAVLKSIDPAPFGAYLTIPDYEGKIVAVEDNLARYNQTLAALDEMLSQFGDEEAELHQLNRRYLSATEAKYGPDSSEYEMVAGPRMSERKRRVR